jgi:hypothetical protein
MKSKLTGKQRRLLQSIVGESIREQPIGVGISQFLGRGSRVGRDKVVLNRMVPAGLFLMRYDKEAPGIILRDLRIYYRGEKLRIDSAMRKFGQWVSAARLALQLAGVPADCLSPYTPKQIYVLLCDSR